MVRLYVSGTPQPDPEVREPAANSGWLVWAESRAPNSRAGKKLRDSLLFLNYGIARFVPFR